MRLYVLLLLSVLGCALNPTEYNPNKPCVKTYNPNKYWCFEWGKDSCCRVLFTKKAMLRWDKAIGSNTCWCSERKTIDSMSYLCTQTICDNE